MSESDQSMTFSVPGMHCAHCERKVSVILESVPGVLRVEPSLADKSVRVTVDASTEVTEETIRGELAAGGYPVG